MPTPTKRPPTTIRTVTSNREIVTTPVTDLIDSDTTTREERRALIAAGAAEIRTNADAPPRAQQTDDLWTQEWVLVRIPVAQRLS